jgi:hypothetical protein
VKGGGGNTLASSNTTRGGALFCEHGLIWELTVLSSGGENIFLLGLPLPDRSSNSKPYIDMDLYLMHVSLTGCEIPKPHVLAHHKN